MNSLGVNPFVNNLYTDCRDGMVLLQVCVSLTICNLFSISTHIPVYIVNRMRLKKFQTGFFFKEGKELIM